MGPSCLNPGTGPGPSKSTILVSTLSIFMVYRELDLHHTDSIISLLELAFHSDFPKPSMNPVILALTTPLFTPCLPSKRD